MTRRVVSGLPLLVPKLQLGNLCSPTACWLPSGFPSWSLGTRVRRVPRNYYPKIRDNQEN